jgi:hypothetical protein
MPRLKPRSKKCFVDVCREPIPVTKLMCYRHWCMVPADLQDEVYSTLRTLRAGGGGQPYIAAIKKAAAAVRKELNL